MCAVPLAEPNPDVIRKDAISVPSFAPNMTPGFELAEPKLNMESE
jgi:hypothetical protein